MSSFQANVVFSKLMSYYFTQSHFFIIENDSNGRPETSFGRAETSFRPETFVRPETSFGFDDSIRLNLPRSMRPETSPKGPDNKTT